MKLSHSKLSCILSCPMTYYLTYKQKIWKKEEKPAFWMGSAVHWGLEHSTSDLTEFFEKKGFKSKDNYTREQLVCEAMVNGYLKHKEEIFDDILSYKGKKLKLIEEFHELEVIADLKSKKYAENHKFVGIIDLLLKTDEGFIIIDYKTSTFEPDWDGYLDQIYRYIFLLRSMCPDIPVIKIGIINLRKSGIRQKKAESNDEFTNRLKFEYELNDERLINYHEFRPEDLDERLIDNYIDNLSIMADLANSIDENELYYINYSAAKGPYGKSDYYDIFYHTPDAYVLYGISDTVYNEDEQKIVDWRDCVPIDMLVCEHDNVLNKFEIFQKELLEFDLPIDEFEDYLKSKYIVDENLIKLYWKTFDSQINF